MRILIVHRYFWPDTPPYAHMLRIMAGRFASDGHDVTVVTSQPSYNPTAHISRQLPREQMDGFSVRRVWLFPENRSNPLARIMNMALFSLRVVLRILFSRYDIVMAATTPPVIISAAASRAAWLKRTQFIYHCQDIHPESGQLAGVITNSFLVGVLRRLDRRTCNLAARIVVLSEDMARTIRERRQHYGSKLHVINNFMLGGKTALDPLLDVSEPHNAKRFRVIFTGNIGRFQGLETIVEAMRCFNENENVELLFIGNGTARESLIARAGALNGSRIVFMPYQPQTIVEELIAKSDIGLIALQKGVYRVAYPSKIATYLKVGCPLLVCLESESELAQLAEREKIGVVVRQPNVPESVAAAIREAREKRVQFVGQRTRMMSLGRQLFGSEQALDKWSRLIAELGCPNI